MDKQIINLFSHILLAEQVWFTRLKGLDSASLPIWEEISIEACAELVKQNHLNYKDYLNGVTENKLEQIVSYRNSKGQEFRELQMRGDSDPCGAARTISSWTNQSASKKKSNRTY